MTTPEQFLIYQSEDGSTRIDVKLQAETIWLSQKQYEVAQIDQIKVQNKPAHPSSTRASSHFDYADDLYASAATSRSWK
jgi:hypothetical protein